MVEAYGYTSEKYESLLALPEAPVIDLKDSCAQLIDQVPRAKLPTLLSVLRGFIA